VAYARELANRNKRDGFLSTVGYSILDATLNDKLLYKETPTDHIQNNWTTSTDTIAGTTITYLRPSRDGITSNVVDGMQFLIKPKTNIPVLDSVRSGWQTGNLPIDVKLNPARFPYFAYDYDIIFVDTTLEPSYKSKTSRKTNPTFVTDVNNGALSASRVLLGQSFPFHVINESFSDSTASGYKSYEQLDLVVHDVNVNGKFDPDTDYVLAVYTVPYLSQVASSATIFGIRFKGGMPKSGDVYRLRFIKALNDSIMFTVNVENTTDASKIEDDMKQIKVVPNPYIVTNTMESYISNQNFNQQRVLLFTHIPAQSTIKIFTSSGVFIRQIDVDNAPDNGNYKWNMLTKEGLDIAAGIYIYHIKSNITGKEKLGKFAVIK
jgi:hypothetical protein